MFWKISLSKSTRPQVIVHLILSFLYGKYDLYVLSTVPGHKEQGEILVLFLKLTIAQTPTKINLKRGNEGKCKKENFSEMNDTLSLNKYIHRQR